MAQQSTRPSAGRRGGGWFWSRLHFLIRLAGLAGVVALLVGLLLARSIDQFYSSWAAAYQTLAGALRGAPPADDWQRAGVYCLLGGVAAVLLALAVDAALVLSFVAGRRSALGFNAVVQIALAAALVVGVNVYSFTHHRPFDCTRAQEFTLPANVRDGLKKLTAPTLIVVYQAHNSLLTPGGKRDAYDSAAERKVVDILNDLVAQFREAGPQFTVVTLDAEDRQFARKLKDLTEDEKHPRPKLRAAIDAAPENCIFFYQDAGGGKVQQLSFDEFYQLDKAASKEAGNLVLLPQGAGGSGRGVETFARRIFNIDERRPRVGILVIHEALTTEGNTEISLRGARAVLEGHGFEVRDVIVKKGWGSPSLRPAADTHEEGRLETIERSIEELNAEVAQLQDDVKDVDQIIDTLTLKPGEDEGAKLEALSRKFVLPDGRRLRWTAELRKQQLAYARKGLAQLEEMLAERKVDLEEAGQDRQRLDLESITESRRLTDVDAKLQRVLDDCDVLLVPRLTRLASGVPITTELHDLEKGQAAAIRTFLRSGKPVLAAFGPLNGDGADDLPRDSEDALEPLLAELGVRLNKQMVLFSADSRAFVERRGGFGLSGEDKIPRLDFHGPTAAAYGRWLSPEAARLERPNPLRQSLRVTARSVGPDFDLRVRFARPVFYDPTPRWLAPAEAAGAVGLLASPQGAGPLAVSATPPRRARAGAAFLVTGYADPDRDWTPAAQAAGSVGTLAVAAVQGPLPALSGLPRQPTEATFLLTGVGWNDDRPFPRSNDPPLRFRPPKSDDPLNGMIDEKRRGQFPVGVAIEAPIPASWGGDGPARARLVVIGQAYLFTGKELMPANQQLLLQSVNWLLGREDYLPTGDHEWRYPRVDLTQRQRELWLWGIAPGMPLVCAFTGFVVLLARRVR
jgi:hypothetical protein